MCFALLAIFLSLVRIIPPPPVEIILLPLKLKTPVKPNVPACFPFLKLPSASVLSSIKGIP